MDLIDVQAVRYMVRIVSEKKEIYNIDNALTSLAWEEQEGQLAQKATITVASECSVNKESIRSILKLNRQVYIYADWGEGNRLLFTGLIWEWNYQHAQKKTLSITVYDPMIRLQQSKDHKYFSKGMDTKAIIGSICRDAGVPVNYAWVYSIKHEKKVFRANTISDMILELLDEVKQQKNSKYVILYRNGKLEINAYGTNKDMYKFGGYSVLSTENKLSLDKLVTRVKILGKADDNGRSKVEAVINGNLDYGILQDIVTRDSDKSLGTAKKEAQTILAENGTPEETITATAPDLPFVRKGDAVEMKAGNLIGIFYVLGVSHNADKRQMTMTLMRQPGTQNSASKSSGSRGDSKDTDTKGGNFQKGDAVILNGPVYVDSYGNGKGRTFTNYKSKITYTAPADRPCPYCIGQVGWVYPNEITKA